MQRNARHQLMAARRSDPATREGAPQAPRAIRDWFERFADCGHPSLLVGECVLQLALGLRPGHYRVHSPISRDALLSLAPRAIPTRIEPATITLPTSAGPLDIVPDRSRAQTLEELKTTPFSVLALAFDPARSEVIAQQQALEDLASRTLSQTPGARACGDPGFAIEAARLIAVYGLRPTRALIDAAGKLSVEVAPAQPTQDRRRLRELLLAPGVREGLRFLRNSGAEAALVPGVLPDAAAIAAGVPAEPRVRFCAWLRDADAKGLLRGFRFGGEFSSSLYRLLEVHPIDQWVLPDLDASLRRLNKRLTSEEIADLLALRRAEARESAKPADAESLLRNLERLEQRLARVRDEQRRRREPTSLSISGADIMRILFCGPGPEVGRAIRLLERTIANDPDANTPEALTRTLEQWRADR